MGSIVLLDEHTINKIAAGEVVDRPASIVKELVENSIDAGATSITVEIKNGGIQYIKVSDNGKGFASDDVEIAFERHATSKIRKEEDLLKITSMGFRGEALASIAAISKVDLVTMNQEEKVGTHARVEAGEVISIEPCPSTVGTKIEIRDVFYNVPARFKFLKKDYTEAGYIEDVITRAALSHPEISFKYSSNGKVVLQTSANDDLKSTIYDIFGKEIYQNVIPIQEQIGEIDIIGMIGLPSISRSTRTHQFTFLNNRYIKDKTINSAIDRACEQKYAINKHPFVVFNMSMNPSHIDVNVHPAKLEVKFDDETKVFQAIYTALRGTIEKNNRETSPFTQAKMGNEREVITQISNDLKNNGMLGNYSNATSKKFDFDLVSKSMEKEEGKVYSADELTEKTQEIDDKIDNKQDHPYLLANDQIEGRSTPLSEEKENKYTTDSVENVENLVLNEDTTTTSSVENGIVLDKTNTKEAFKFDNVKPQVYDETDVIPEEQIKPYTYIGQVFNTYIIIQIGEKMYIIDQHAAHERLLYEQIKEAYYAKDRESQLLLIPLLIELSEKEKTIVDENREMFEKAGFILEDFGKNTLKIAGVPNIGYEIEYKSMFKDMIDDLLGASKTEQKEKEFRFIATLACKAAVKGKMKLDRQEQITLIDQMIKLENPFTCPHGRPTAYEISKYEIERKFLRK